MVGGMGIFELPAMIEPDGSWGNFIVALAGIGITMVIAFAATMILYKDKKEEAVEVQDGEETLKQVSEPEAAVQEKEEKQESLFVQTEIASPMKGKVLKLESIKDDAFASAVLGKGAAVLPEEGKVYAPADGVISTLFPTLHALGMETDEGVELLIHIGLDTVQLNGEGFEAKVSQGDRVKKGQLLVTFDKEFIESKGYCMETPVIVTNTDDFLEVVEIGEGETVPGDGLLKVLK